MSWTFIAWGAAGWVLVNVLAVFLRLHAVNHRQRIVEINRHAQFRTPRNVVAFRRRGRA